MRALTFLASRFVAGDDVDDAVSAVRELNELGIKATLDNLGEDSLTREKADAAAAENLLMLKRINETGLDSNISLKLTQLGLALDENLAKDHRPAGVRPAAVHRNRKIAKHLGQLQHQRVVVNFKGHAARRHANDLAKHRVAVAGSTFDR